MMCSTIPCTKWIAIATRLELEEDAIAALKCSNVTEEEKLESVFLQWKKKQNPPYTKSALIQLLESKEVAEFDLADALGEPTIMTCYIFS